MGKLIWDKIGERRFEAGVQKGVLYPSGVNNTYLSGVVWNGLVSVTEKPSGAEPTPLYADNIKYLNLMSAEEYGSTIEAFTYPDEFAACNGESEIAEGVSIGQQERTAFGMSYQTKIGNDTNSDLGYKIHLVYGAKASPSEKNYGTINESPEATTFSWEVSTTKVAVDNKKPTACVTIDSTVVDATKLAAFEEIIYGKDYTLTTEAPTDWATTYTSYYTKSGTTYSAVTSSGSAPAWAANTYYSAPVDARLPLPNEVATLLGTVVQG